MMRDTHSASRPVEVLLAEDNENDVVLTREGLKEARVILELHHVTNGKECLDFLRKQGNHTAAPTPDLVLLDLNMPVMDGREVLEAIVSDDHLKHLPIVILTTSSDEADILRMYKLRCSSYITKPVDFDQFVQVIREITEYWFMIVALPRHQQND